MLSRNGKGSAGAECAKFTPFGPHVNLFHATHNSEANLPKHICGVERLTFSLGKGFARKRHLGKIAGARPSPYQYSVKVFFVICPLLRFGTDFQIS